MPSNTTFHLANPVFPTVTFPALRRDTISKVASVPTYVHDQISLGGRFEVVAGLRYDRFDITRADLQPDPDRPVARADDKVSPRLGLIYKPQFNVSIHRDYGQSFLPRSGDQVLTLSQTEQNLEPEPFTNREVGAKWNISPRSIHRSEDRQETFAKVSLAAKAPLSSEV